METPRQLLDTRVNVFLAHRRELNKALKPFGWRGRRAERIVDPHTVLADCEDSGSGQTGGRSDRS